MGNVTKKQHYISEFYLKLFSEDKKRIFCIDKKCLNIRRPLLKDVGEERYFYDFKLRDKYEKYSKDFKNKIDEACIVDYGKTYSSLTLEEKIIIDQKLEKLFCTNVEMPLSKIINKIIKRCETLRYMNFSNEYFINDEDKKKLSSLLIVQHMRTKAFRNQIAEFNIGFYKSLLKTKTNVDLKINYTDEAKQIMHIKSLFNENEISTYSNAIYDHKWILYINNSKLPFLTSDNPMMFYPPRNFKGNFCGFKTPGVILGYPLTPKIMLVMIERTKHPLIEDKRYRVIFDEAKIDQLNDFIIWNACDSVFASNEYFAGLAKKKLETNPELRNFIN